MTFTETNPMRPFLKQALPCALALLALAAAPAAHAQANDYPGSKPIRFLVGFAAGGSTDIISRLLAQKFTERMGASVVVEQKPGATGVIANDVVAKAPPDGLTMVLLTGGHPASAAIMKSLPYDPVKDFGMVSTVTAYPMVISVAPDSPIKSLADLIARAKAAPGTLSYSSAGVGSLHHLFGEWLNIEAGTSMIHVPFKGAAPAFTEVLGKRVDVMIETATFSFGQIKGGKLRPLALSSNGRYPLMPDAPAANETVKTVELSSWLGLATSPGTPRPIIDKLNRELRVILEMPDVRERFAQLGGVPTPSSPEEMAARVDREVLRWKRVVEVKNIERQ
jgi:tripartite-type tricarboxylate transporter receptor subunit TctC